jgi:hypothetical protein
LDAAGGCEVRCCVAQGQAGVARNPGVLQWSKHNTQNPTIDSFGVCVKHIRGLA